MTDYDDFVLREMEKHLQPDAQYRLGMMYLNGDGVKHNLCDAFEWFAKAAEQGHAEAQYMLGTMYANGQGVWQDDKKAKRWFAKAAKQRKAEARNHLGWRYAILEYFDIIRCIGILFLTALFYESLTDIIGEFPTKLVEIYCLYSLLCSQQYLYLYSDGGLAAHTDSFSNLFHLGSKLTQIAFLIYYAVETSWLHGFGLYLIGFIIERLAFFLYYKVFLLAPSYCYTTFNPVFFMVISLGAIPYLAFKLFDFVM